MRRATSSDTCACCIAPVRRISRRRGRSSRLTCLAATRHGGDEQGEAYYDAERGDEVDRALAAFVNTWPWEAKLPVLKREARLLLSDTARYAYGRASGGGATRGGRGDDTRARTAPEPAAGGARRRGHRRDLGDLRGDARRAEPAIGRAVGGEARRAGARAAGAADGERPAAARLAGSVGGAVGRRKGIRPRPAFYRSTARSCGEPASWA